MRKSYAPWSNLCFACIRAPILLDIPLRTRSARFRPRPAPGGQLPGQVRYRTPVGVTSRICPARDERRRESARARDTEQQRIDSGPENGIVVDGGITGGIGFGEQRGEVWIVPLAEHGGDMSGAPALGG